jgi:hypothetical protein
MVSRYPNIEAVMFFDGDEGRGLDQVKAKLLEIAVRRSQSMPHTYLELADLLESVAGRLERSSRPPVMDIEEMYSIVLKQSEFFSLRDKRDELSGEEQKKADLKRLESAFLFLHDLGRVIFFGNDMNDGQMAGKIVLQPQWLTRCLACIVTQEVKGTYIKKGRILHSDLVNFVWRSNDFPTSLHQYLLSVLEMYEVIFPMPNQPDVHIVPALLPPERPSERLTMFPPLFRPLEETFLSSQSLLSRQYTFNFLPSGLITRLFIRMMKYYSHFTDCVYWRNGICLELAIMSIQKELCHTYVLAELIEEDRTVEIRVRSPLSSVSSTVLLVVTGLIQNLIHEWYHLSPNAYSILVPCISCMTKPVPRLHAPSYSRLSVRSETGSDMRLSMLLNSTNVGSGTVIKVLLERQPQIGATSITIPLTDTLTASEMRDKIVKSVTKLVGEADREEVSEMLKGNQIYAVNSSGGAEILTGNRNVTQVFLLYRKQLVFYFTPCRPLLLDISVEYSDQRPSVYPLPFCEGLFMEGKMSLTCKQCGESVPLESLVPDVVLSDIEQYGCEVVKDGQLHLLRRVGKGAFGDVFLGKYKERDVAVKQILLGTSNAAEILKEFQKELRLGSMLNHPNVVKIEAFTMHPFQLVMEFIPCGDLYTYLNDPEGVQKYLRSFLSLSFSLSLSLSLSFFLSSLSPLCLTREFLCLPLHLVDWMTR